MAVIKSRPVTGVNSESANAAATAGLLMWTIDSLCVSSYSSACESAPLANAAEVTPTRSPKPRMRQGPAGDIATTASRVDFPNAVSAPASDSPITSITRSLVASTTSAGKSSNRTRDAHAASVAGKWHVHRTTVQLFNLGFSLPIAMLETQTLASYVVTSRIESVPDDVRHEARRAIVNYVGCALGGSVDTAVDRAIQALGPYSGKPTASILGRSERMDPLHASLMNGISSHVYDFDDTTPKNYIHPTSPVASALFAYASANKVSGRDFMEAFILGFEAESRIGNAVYPAHYDVGWHITGTAGVFGAAAAIGKLLNLQGQEMIWAIGLAATQAAGLREMFGSMAKALHPGRAAQNGYAAALLAQAGFTAGEHGLEGPRGFAAVQAAKYDLSKITARLGEDFDLRANTYKPFPCGIVNHPTIDGCIQIHDEHRLDRGSDRGCPPACRALGDGSL